MGRQKSATPLANLTQSQSGGNIGLEFPRIVCDENGGENALDFPEMAIREAMGRVLLHATPLLGNWHSIFRQCENCGKSRKGLAAISLMYVLRKNLQHVEGEDVGLFIGAAPC